MHSNQQKYPFDVSIVNKNEKKNGTQKKICKNVSELWPIFYIDIIVTSRKKRANATKIWGENEIRCTFYRIHIHIEKYSSNCYSNAMYMFCQIFPNQKSTCFASYNSTESKINQTVLTFHTNCENNAQQNLPYIFVKKS